MAELSAKRVDVTIHESPTQFVGYSNINGVTLTPEEAIMHFGIRRLDSPNEADGVAKIYLSLPHAKRIMLVLSQLIRDYELMFGEVKPDAEDRLTPEGFKRFQDKLAKGEEK